MFINERPIGNKDEDFLGRYPFAEKLSKALYDWKEEESLVISLTGKWGSGKSSVFNLIKEYIRKDESDNKPSLIDFNPWMFSNINNLSNQFFKELAKELKIKNKSKKDKELADKILYYSELLNVIPSPKDMINLTSTLTIGFGLFGIAFSKFISFFNLANNTIKIFLFIAGIILLSIELLRKISSMLKYKAKLSKKSISELKSEIQNILIERTEKLIIFIDDIDRLTPKEIKEIFKLIRVNADFPNTIYLLAYDNKIIEKSIEIKDLINGKSYIDKIVQVNFDLPKINQSKITKYLLKEIDRVLALLPKSFEDYFDQQYWSETYHAGSKYIFKTLRDVKRYISSLEFNLSLMFKENSLEVNPIDFIAIEAIRVFSPSFYEKLKTEKDLFTMSNSDLSFRMVEESKKKEIAKKQFQKIIDIVPEEKKEIVKKLIFHLFPDLGNACKERRNYFSTGNYSNWRKNLNVCSPIHFDTYFAMIPGGDEEEISQFEIDNFISNIENISIIEDSLNKYHTKDKLKNFIERFRDYVDDREKIQDNFIQNLIQAFFNVSDKLKYQGSNLFEINLRLSLTGVINALLKRFEIKKRFLILQETIRESSSVTLPFEIVSLEVHLSKEKEEENKSEFLREEISQLQDICITKINSIESKQELINLDELSSILYWWSEWSDGKEFNKFINTVKSDIALLLPFVDKFFTITTSSFDNRFSVKQYKRLHVENLKNLIEPALIVDKFRAEKNEKSDVYNNNKDLIDKILDNIENDKHT